MATQTDPVEALAAVVNRLYDLSSDASIPSVQQQQLLVQAHDLRGDLVALVSLQLSATDSEYQNLMKSVTAVTDALNQAEEKIKGVVSAIGGVAQVTAAIDNLVKEAILLGTTAAKLAVA